MTEGPLLQYEKLGGLKSPKIKCRDKFRQNEKPKGLKVHFSQNERVDGLGINK